MAQRFHRGGVTVGHYAFRRYRVRVVRPDNDSGRPVDYTRVRAEEIMGLRVIPGGDRLKLDLIEFPRRHAAKRQVVK
jgi:hypothetical protein